MLCHLRYEYHAQYFNINLNINVININVRVNINMFLVCLPAVCVMLPAVPRVL